MQSTAYEVRISDWSSYVFSSDLDLVIMLEDCFFPLSRVLGAGQTGPDFALSDKIGNAVSEAARLYSGNFGWQPILYPRGNMVLFNEPGRASCRERVWQQV